MLAAWKRRCPPDGVLEEDLDGRTAHALKKLVARLLDRKAADRSWVTVHNTMDRFSDLVALCQRASHSRVPSLDDATLERYIVTMIQQQVHIGPPRTLKNVGSQMRISF